MALSVAFKIIPFAMFSAARQNPVCASFHIHQRNRQETFNNKSLFVRTVMKEITEVSFDIIISSTYMYKHTHTNKYTYKHTHT